jgi:hypothetical protein
MGVGPGESTNLTTVPGLHARNEEAEIGPIEGLGPTASNEDEDQGRRDYADCRYA